MEISCSRNLGRYVTRICKNLPLPIIYLNCRKIPLTVITAISFVMCLPLLIKALYIQYCGGASNRQFIYVMSSKSWTVEPNVENEADCQNNLFPLYNSSPHPLLGFFFINKEFKCQVHSPIVARLTCTISMYLSKYQCFI